jgi:hypothetical protein
MNKVWLKNYPSGVPAEINPNEYPSLTTLIDSCCRRFGPLDAFSSLGRTITYAEYDSRATSPPGCSRARSCSVATGSRSCCRTSCSIRSHCSAHCAPG